MQSIWSIVDARKKVARGKSCGHSFWSASKSTTNRDLVIISG